MSFLNKLTNLKRLELDTNQITDLSPISKLNKLEELGLTANPIDNLDPLLKLSGLKKLTLYRIPKLTKAKVDELKKVLPECSISHNATN